MQAKRVAVTHKDNKRKQQKQSQLNEDEEAHIIDDAAVSNLLCQPSTQIWNVRWGASIREPAFSPGYGMIPCMALFSRIM